LISKSQIKLITRLQQKKYRNKTGLFVAEGRKIISEFLAENRELYTLYVTCEDLFPEQRITVLSEKELARVSFLKTPNNCLAVFKIPVLKLQLKQGLIVALDAIRDPGNLGAIIRLCDWFGVLQIVCSLDTVDCYNPKVVQASMGSLARVSVAYTNLDEFLKKTALPVLGACLDGENMYKTQLPENAVLVMGNEANGISPEIESVLTQKVTIPRFGNLQKPESLNVATATAIVLSRLRGGMGEG